MEIVQTIETLPSSCENKIWSHSHCWNWNDSSLTHAPIISSNKEHSFNPSKFSHVLSAVIKFYHKVHNGMVSQCAKFGASELKINNFISIKRHALGISSSHWCCNVSNFDLFLNIFHDVIPECTYTKFISYFKPYLLFIQVKNH